MVSNESLLADKSVYLKNTRLLNTLKKLAGQHISFVILITSSIAYYVFNLWLKYIFNEIQYSEYSLLNSYLAISMTFAVLGGDQLLLRESKIENNKIIIQKNILIFCSILLLSFSIFSSLFIEKYFEINTKIVLLICCSILFGITTISFSLFRLNSNYSLAQVQKNLWKISIFPICTAYYTYYKEISLNTIIVAIIISLVVTILISIKGTKNIKIIIKSNKELNFKLWFWFALSMLVMNLITNADRFVIDKYIGANEVGKYFFLQNIFLFPLTQIQNYSGFREFTVFKNSYSINSLNESIKKNVAIALILCLFLFGTTYLIQCEFKYIIDLKSNFLIIGLLMLNGVIRIIYSVVSAALGAVGKLQTIKTINILSAVLFVLFFIILINVNISIITISLYFLSLWSSRTLITYIYLLKK